MPRRSAFARGARRRCGARSAPRPQPSHHHPPDRKGSVGVVGSLRAAVCCVPGNGRDSAAISADSQPRPCRRVASHRVVSRARVRGAGLPSGLPLFWLLGHDLLGRVMNQSQRQKPVLLNLCTGPSRAGRGAGDKRGRRCTSTSTTEVSSGLSCPVPFPWDIRIS